METRVRLNSGFGFFVLFAAEVAKPLCPSGELWVCAKSPCVSIHAHTHTGREGELPLQRGKDSQHLTRTLGENPESFVKTYLYGYFFIIITFCLFAV